MKSKSLEISIFCLAFSLLSLPIIFTQDNTTDIHQMIEEKSHSIFKSLVEIRRYFHQYPELSGQEIRTANKIEERLKELGLEVISNIGGHGVVGILKGKKRKPVIAWRADIDAVKDTNPDPVEFVSKNNGIRHSCGHDVHTTIALGIVETLASIENDINGTVMFIFQPAEETGTGAKQMLEDGIFSKMKPQAIFALHVAPLNAGLIAVKPKEMFSRSKDLVIELTGNGDLNQAAEFCSKLIKESHTITDSINLYDPIILLHPQFGLHNLKGIFTQYLGAVNTKVKKITIDSVIVTAHFAGSSEEMCQNAFANINKGILNSKWKDNLKSMYYSFEHFSVYNDPKLTKTAMNIITSHFGEKAILPLYGVNPYSNDDFAIFQEEIPGVYFLLGASNSKKGIFSFPHTPNFNVDENCIQYGVEIFSTMLFEYLIKN